MDKVLDAWHSGQVVRKHTMMNNRAENNAEHTWGVMHILLSIWPFAGRNTIIFAQYHDLGEKAAGDMPGPTKWSNPEVAKHVEDIEQKHIEEVLNPELVESLKRTNLVSKLMVEFCDRVEFCYSMYREAKLGNRYAISPFTRSFAKAYDTLVELEQTQPEVAAPARAFWPSLITLGQKMEAMNVAG